jgi:hypothetical protein
MNQPNARTQVGPRQLTIVALTIATALIHIVLAIGTSDLTTKVMFTLNGLGYLALVTALYLPPLASYRRRVRWALLAYTAVTILGWVAVGERSPTGYLDKAIEVALLVLLFLEARQPEA